MAATITVGSTTLQINGGSLGQVNKITQGPQSTVVFSYAGGGSASISGADYAEAVGDLMQLQHALDAFHPVTGFNVAN